MSKNDEDLGWSRRYSKWKEIVLLAMYIKWSSEGSKECDRSLHEQIMMMGLVDIGFGKGACYYL